jgi:Caspase domain
MLDSAVGGDRVLPGKLWFMRSCMAFLACFVALGSAVVAEERVALVVGNGAYRHTAILTNAPNDARVMAKTLRDTGFRVVEAVDVDKPGMDTALRRFSKALATADVGLVFFAGHGLQVGGQSYLLPIDAKLESERDVHLETVGLATLLELLEAGRLGKTSIVMLDACRDNPLARNLARSMGTRSASVGRGLAAPSAGVGTFISFSTQPGNVALDGVGPNSPYTAALARHVRETPGSITDVMIAVRKDVLAVTEGKQVPWDHSALTGAFYFRDPGPRHASPVTASVEPPRVAGPPKAVPGRCITIEHGVAIAVERGSQFCTADGRQMARIVRVEERDLRHSTNGGPELLCRFGELCGFDFTSGPVMWRVQSAPTGLVLTFQ